jgi:NADH-quinone oxidoreductase subunit N
MTWLAVIVVVNAAAAAFYYLRVVVYMYMRDPIASAAPASRGVLLRGGLVAAMVGTIVLGVLPNWPIPVLDAAKAAAEALF